MRIAIQNRLSFSHSSWIACFALCVTTASAIALRASAGEVRASEFGWNAEDATAALQAAIDSGAERVVVDRQEGDWIVRPIFLRKSNQEVIIADGVTVRAKKDEFRAVADSLMSIPLGGVSNVTLRGEGKATLAMRKADYRNRALYRHSQWRHAVSIKGAKNVVVKDLEILSSGGDGVYVAWNAQNVLLENLVCRDHHRQGISVISAVGLKASHCVFADTRGTPPQCGLDIEPNGGSDKLDNIVFEDCEFRGNALHGIQLWLDLLAPASRPVSITFRRCRASSNANTGALVSSGFARGEVVFEDCVFEGNRGKAFAVGQHKTGALTVTVRDSLMDAKGGRGPAVSFSNGSHLDDFGGITFEKVRVVPGPGGGVRYDGTTGTGLDTTTFKGGYSEKQKDGSWRDISFADLAKTYPTNAAALKILRDFPVAEVDFRKARSLPDAAPLAKPADTHNFRGKFTFVQYVPSAGEWPVVFRATSIHGPQFKFRASVRVRDMSGIEVDSFTIDGPVVVTNILRTTEGGAMRYDVDCGRGLVSVESKWPGQGVLAGPWVHPFGGVGRRYYFAVPPGSDPVRVMIKPQEACCAKLRAPDGSVVAEMPYGTDQTLLEAKREVADKTTIWSLELPRVEEDAEFRIGAPAMPVVSTDVSAVLLFE